MVRPLCIATIAFCLFSCADKPESPATPAASSAPANASTKVEASAPEPAKPVAATDPFAEEYASIRSQITRWDGDIQRLDNARERILQIIAKDKTYAPAYVALARIELLKTYEQEREKEQEQPSQPEGVARAEKFLKHALELDPNSFDAHRTSAWMAMYNGDYDIAEESLRTAEALRPEDPGLDLVRAYIALRQRELQKAVQFARKVTANATDPDDRADGHRILVLIYESGLHLDEADGSFRELLKLRPDSATAHAGYAGLLLQRDDVDGAIREGEEATRIRKFPIAKFILTQAYLRRAQELWDAKKVAESASFVEKVAALSDEDARVSFALGEFYEGAAVRGHDASMRKKALAAYKRALEIDPRNMEAERAVSRLERSSG